MATDNQVIIDVQVDYSQAVRNLAELKSELDRLKAAEKDLTEQRKLGIISEQEWRLETTRLTEQQKRIQTEIRRTSKEVQTVARAQVEEQRILQGTATNVDLANASYNELSRTYTRMKDRINQMSAAERQANQAYIQQSQQVYERMKEMQSETGKMQLNVGNYENAILSAIGVNGRFASSLISGAGAEQGFAGATRVATQAVTGFGKTLLGLLTNPVFLVIAGVAAVGAAFKFWMDYNDGIAEATRLTREFVAANDIDATTQQIANMRAEIQAVADVYGKEYKETLQAVDTLMSQFGIDAKTALEVVEKGFAAGADLNEDFLSSIQQYAPAFRDAGIEADEFIAILQQTRSGLFSKDGLDLIVKAGQNIRKMSKSTSDALKGVGIDAQQLQQQLSNGEITMLQAIQRVSAALKTVGANSKEAGEIIQDVFGRKGAAAGQEQIKAFSEISTSLDEVLEKTGEYGKLQQEIVESQKELNRYTEALFGSNGWETLKQKAEIYWNQALTKVLKFTLDIANAFVKMYNNSELVRASIASGVLIVKALWSVFVEFFKAVAMGFKGIADVIKGINDFDWREVAAGVRELVTIPAAQAKGITTAITDAFKEAQKQVKAGHLNEFNLEVDTSLPGGTGGSGYSGGGSSDTSSSSGGGGDSIKDTEKAAKDAADKRKKLEEQLQKELTQMLIKNEKDRTAQINAEYDQRIADLKAKYKDLADSPELAQLIDEVEKQREAALKKYNDDTLKQELQQRAALIQMQMETFDMMAQNEATSMADRTAAMSRALNARLAALAIQQQQEVMQYEGNQEMITAIDKKYQQERAAALAQYTTAVGQLTKQQVEEQTKAMEVQAKGYSDTLSAMSSILGEFGDESREAAIASKVLAVAQVAIEQGVAIAKATAAGSGLPFPANLAAIASGIAAVMSSIMSAVKAVNKAKFAEGGLVEGAGTGTSDSIPAMLSNGESVITARSTKAFAPLLSAINLAGGGVPISAAGGSSTVMGEAMLSRAFAAALREMPNPVVAVSEIERVENRVKVIENFSQL